MQGEIHEESVVVSICSLVLVSSVFERLSWHDEVVDDVTSNYVSRKHEYLDHGWVRKSSLVYWLRQRRCEILLVVHTTTPAGSSL